MAEEFLQARAMQVATEGYAKMTERGTALLDTAQVSIPAALDEVERRAQVVSGLTGTAVDAVDPETGVRVTGINLGPGGTLVLGTVAAVDSDTGVLVTGLNIGGLV